MNYKSVVWIISFSVLALLSMAGLVGGLIWFHFSRISGDTVQMVFSLVVALCICMPLMVICGCCIASPPPPFKNDNSFEPT